MKLRPWLAAPIALALGGCDFAPRYAPPIGRVAGEIQGRDRRAAATLPAKRACGGAASTTERSTISQAQVDAANPDSRRRDRGQRRAVARANAALSAAYPQIDGGRALYCANKQSANRPLRSANQPTYYGDNLIGAQVAYEIDIWGRVRDIVKAANATAEASADALADARLELHAELARDYVNLRGLDDQAKLLADTIAIYRSALELTEDRLAAQIASPVDVDRAQTQLSSAEAQVVRPRAQSGDAGERHRGAGRQSRRLIFGRRGPRGALPPPDAAARRAGRRVASAGRTSPRANG